MPVIELEEPYTSLEHRVCMVMLLMHETTPFAFILCYDL